MIVCTSVRVEVKNETTIYSISFVLHHVCSNPTRKVKRIIATLFLLPTTKSSTMITITIATQSHNYKLNDAKMINQKMTSVGMTR